MDDDGGEGGRKRVVTDEKILRLVFENPDPAVGAGELADELPISQPGVYKRLKELVERGLLDSKKVGPGRIYWITDDGIEFLESDDE